MRTVNVKSADHFKNAVYPSPFHSRQKEHNQLREWSRWSDYLSVPAYWDESMEYFSGRNACGVFDITPMVKHRITGPDALPYLNRLMTRDVSKIKPGRVGYSVWCNDNGQVIDDGTIFHLKEGDYRICSQEHQLDWFLTNTVGFDVSVVEETHDVAGLAVQGPTSCAVLKQMGLAGIENLTPFGLTYFDFEGAEMLVSRTGFTGDLGYELWIRADLGLQMWDELYAAGEDYGIQPFGEAATNMARLEAAFIMPAMEFNEALRTVHFEHDQTPFELNLGWLVDFRKPHFSGRRALLEEKQRGPKYTLTKLDIEGNKPAEGSYIYANKRCTREIGYVTSAMWSPAVKANIALAMIKTEFLRDELWAEIYYEKELRQYSRVARCTRKDKPFWTPARAKATPPPDF